MPLLLGFGLLLPLRWLLLCLLWYWRPQLLLGLLLLLLLWRPCAATRGHCCRIVC